MRCSGFDLTFEALYIHGFINAHQRSDVLVNNLCSQRTLAIRQRARRLLEWHLHGFQFCEWQTTPRPDPYLKRLHQLRSLTPSRISRRHSYLKTVHRTHHYENIHPVFLQQRRNSPRHLANGVDSQGHHLSGTSLGNEIVGHGFDHRYHLHTEPFWRQEDLEMRWMRQSTSSLCSGDLGIIAEIVRKSRQTLQQQAAAKRVYTKAYSTFQNSRTEYSSTHLRT